MTITLMAIDAAAFMAVLASPGRQCEPTVAALEDLWPVSPDRLGRALTAAGVDVDEDDAVESFLRIDEQLVLESERNRTVSKNPGQAALIKAAQDDQGAIGRLHISWSLLDLLPLIPLARDIAFEFKGLSVRKVDSARITPARGVATPGGLTDRAVVLLSDDLSPTELPLVWAHELGHLLDFRPWVVAHDRSEAFADDLAWRLLEHEPITMAQAAPLIGEALQATEDLRWPEAHSLTALLEWSVAEITSRRART
jgi:hypothetical protein